MKRWFLVIMTGMLCVIFAGGCGSMKKFGKKKSPEELAIAQESAIRGEDIPLEAIPEGEFVEPESANITGVFEDVFFEYDRSRIRETDYPALNRIGKWLEDNPVNVMIEGHCDERGSNEYNMALGEQRALSIRQYLVGLGLDSAKLHTVSYGEEKPRDEGHDESAWAKNRRGHFLVAK